MLFGSAVFLFLFLPVVLGANAVVPKRLRNALLVTASLLFYAWGEPRFIAVMLGSIVVNFGCGLWLKRVDGRSSTKAVLTLAVAANLGLLAVFKYANFFA